MSVAEGEQRRFDVVDAVTALLVSAWVLVITVTRFAPGFERWRAETDAKQVTHQFYAWFDRGTFPSGELLEQYADIYNAPPLYKFLMATLSSVCDPKDAATGLSVALYLATIATLYVVGWRRGGSGLAAAAALLYTHAEGPLLATVGGHPRSFAPLFFALFLWSLVERRRGLMLALLVLEGGIYPSPLLACGPAAAIVVAIDFWRDRRPRPVLWFLFASVLALGLAKAQDLRAPKEWGRIISYEEALQHPAWQKGSRFPYVPLPPFWRHPEEAVKRLVAPVGAPLVKGADTALALIFCALALAGVVAQFRRRRFEVAPELLLLTATLFAHLLARHLAFQLHIPHRAVAHGWPVLLASAIPTLAWLGVPRRSSTAGRIAGGVAAALVLVPLVVCAGTGVQSPQLWRDYSKDARLYEWLQKKTPKDALFAGNFQIMDEVPLFGHRRVYVNWKLAHPYRLGYFDLVTERTRKMYAALYARNIDDVIAFGDETGVDYIIVNPARFKSLEKGDGQLFEPLRGMVKPMFAACERERCALDPPPKEAVVFKTPRYLVVSIEALRRVAK
jgi:hypothetical protein